MNAVFVIAVKEIRDGLRNRWVAATILLLAGLALSLYVLGSMPVGSVKASAMSVTVVSLSGLTVYLLPLIALMLSFDALVGEVERGTMLLLLAYPVRRWQVVGGKFIGHVCILILAILIGYGGTAVMIALTHESRWQDVGVYLAMMGSSLLLGTVFVGLGYLVSAVARERASAAALAVGLWVVLVVAYDVALLGFAVADQGRMLGQDLFSLLLLINPTDAYRMFNLTAGDTVSQVAGMVGLPHGSTFDPLLLLAVMSMWALLAVSGATCVLHRREL